MTFRINVYFSLNKPAQFCTCMLWNMLKNQNYLEEIRLCKEIVLFSIGKAVGVTKN